MIFINIILYLNIFSSVILCYASESYSESEETDFYDQLMIDINKEEDGLLLDPNDMFVSIQQPVKGYEKDKKKLWDSDGCDCTIDNLDILKCHKESDGYLSKISLLESQLKTQEKLIIKLQKQLRDDNVIDFESFYFRILHKLWSLLEMEELERMFHSENEAILRYLVLQVSATDVIAFKDLLQGERKMLLQIDEFFQGHISREDQKISLYLDYFQDLKIHFQSFEVWMTLLWSVLVALGVWAFWLFVRDIKRELRWGKVIALMFFLVFVLSFLSHWRHMLKVAESKRHKSVLDMEMGNKGGEVCKEDDSYFNWFRIHMFSGQPHCEKYYDNLLISPEEEISPMMVISETVSIFVLLPLKEIGRGSGLFFKHFYENVPWLLQIPVTLVFLFLVTMFGLMFFGYGIHFPFWLGGIRPSRQPAVNSDSVKQLIKESEENNKIQTMKLINEAKQMLTQISETAVLHVQNSDSHTRLESILQRSTSVIERKLEHIINEKLSHALEEQECVSPETDDSVVRYRGASRARSVEAKDKVDGKSPSSNPSDPIPLRFGSIQGKSSPRKGTDSRRTPVKDPLDSGTRRKTGESPFLAQVKDVFKDCPVEIRE